MQLTNHDIEKIQRKKRSRIFCTIKILGMAFLFNFSYLKLIDESYWNVSLLIISNILFALACIIVPILRNVDFNKDLKIGKKIIKKERIEKKVQTNQVLQPFNRIAHSLFKYQPESQVIINNNKYKIDSHLFEELTEGDIVKIHYAIKSKLLLDIELVHNSEDIPELMQKY